MDIYESECFTIGNCEFPASIEYEADQDDITVHSCMIEVAAADFTVWAKVDPEYFPAIEKQLKQDLLEAAERERNEITTPDQHAGDWPRRDSELPYFLRRQAS